MNTEQLLILLLAMPLVSALVILLLPIHFKLNSIAHLISSVTSSFLGIKAISCVINGETIYALDKMLFLDSVGGVFLSLISVTGVLINFYSVSYMKWEIEKNAITIKDAKLFFTLSHIFIFTMTFSVISNNIALMWAAIEATTLSSVFMVALYKSKHSTESGWKYIVICSIGLAFALYATVLLYGAGFVVIKDSHSTMLWSTLVEHAKELNVDALKLIFVFALIGFGTKAGLAPTHTWLPDAHSEGPSPVSAFLSAVLLKCAFLAIIRYYAIAGQSLLGFGFVEMLLLIVSILSIFIAALFILRQNDIKRMFAYCSVEHIGIIAFGFGVGGPLGIFAGLFHAMSHSLTKALAFCVSGNIMKIYGTRDMGKMGGLVKIAPISAILFAITICSLTGVPPLAIFLSEFFSIKAAFNSEQYIAVVLFILGLAIVFVGLFSHFNRIMFGEAKCEIIGKEASFSANLPLVILAILIICFGVFAFESWITLLNNATKIIIGH